MKYKNIKVLLLCFPFAVASCTLDYDPVSDYSEVTVGTNDEEGNEIPFKNRAEMLTQYEGMYKRMTENQEHWCLDALLISDAHADNAYAGTTGAEVLPFENNAIEGSNSVLARDWDRFLEDIAIANRIICNIDAVPDESFSQAERNQWKAEAKIYRAMIMFDMARYWGSFPVITTEAPDITSENIEEVYPLYFPVQSTEEEAYTQIEKDLLEAIEYAPANNTAKKTVMSKSVAHALLTKVYAEKPLRNYNKVIEYADKVIAQFSLVSDLSDIFGMNPYNTDTKMRNTSESILELQYFTGNGNWVTWMFGRDVSNWDLSFEWAKWITPSRDLIKAYDDEGDAIRKQQAIVYYTCNWSNYYPANNYPFMYKCRSAYSSIIKLRLADILLLKAEALIQTNDLAGAATIINQIRTRAKLPELTANDKSSKDNMLKAYLKERRLELAFEGQRWFDLVRLDKVEEVMNAVYAKDSGRRTQVYQFNEDSYRLAIPQAAIDQNPNLVQNPGY